MPIQRLEHIALETCPKKMIIFCEFKFILFLFLYHFEQAHCLHSMAFFFINKLPTMNARMWCPFREIFPYGSIVNGK